MMLPPDLDREGMESARLRVEELMNCLTAEAETWATAGTRKANEVAINPGKAPRPQRILTPAIISATLKPSRAA
jgi:hypothetical protein